MNIIKDIAKSIRDFPTRLRVCFISCRLSIRKFSFSLPISTYFDKNVRFQLRSYKKRIDVGENVFIGYGSRFALSGGNLLIGENCQLGDHNIYNCFADIKIGKKVLTADNVSFITNRHDYSNPDLAILDQGGVLIPLKLVKEHG